MEKVRIVLKRLMGAMAGSFDCYCYLLGITIIICGN